MTRHAVLYLAASALSLLGNSVVAVALPLLVLLRTGSATSAGTVALATAVPAVLVGIVGGLVIDRVGRRRASIVSDTVSAVAVAALPVVDLVTGLDLGWFVALGVLGAIGDVPGMTAREALVPAVARSSGVALERLVGIRESIEAGVMVVGPALAGVLLVTLGDTTVLWVTAATSALAALVTAMLPKALDTVPASPPTAAGAHPAEPLQASRTQPDGADALERSRSASAVLHGRGGRTRAALRRSCEELRAGLAVVLRDRLLLAGTLLSLGSLLVLAGLQGIVLPVHFTTTGEPGRLGLVLSAMAAGLLVGATLYSVLGPRLSPRAVFVASMLGVGVGVVGMSLLPVTWLLLASAAVTGVSSGLMNPVLQVAMMRRTPEAARGRVLGLQGSAMMAVAPVAVFGAGLLVDAAGLRTTGVVVAVGFAVVVVLGVLSPALRGLGDSEEGEGYEGYEGYEEGSLVDDGSHEDRSHDEDAPRSGVDLTSVVRDTRDHPDAAPGSRTPQAGGSSC